MTFYHKAFESQHVNDDLFCVCFFSSVVLEVWWTLCSSVLGYLISIQPLHHSLHSVEVTKQMFFIILCMDIFSYCWCLLLLKKYSLYFCVCFVLTVTIFTPSLKFVLKKKRLRKRCSCLCTQDSFPDRNEQSRQ